LPISWRARLAPRLAASLAKSMQIHSAHDIAYWLGFDWIGLFCVFFLLVSKK
jgi:hypothetical protein